MFSIENEKVNNEEDPPKSTLNCQKQDTILLFRYDEENQNI